MYVLRTNNGTIFFSYNYIHIWGPLKMNKALRRKVRVSTGNIEFRE